MAKKKKYSKDNPNINKIKSQRFCHGVYKIIWKKPYGAKGLCTDPKDRTIYIDPKLNGKDLICTCIDENIHACLFQLDNDFVDEMSDCIGEFLYRIGFRLEKKK